MKREVIETLNLYGGLYRYIPSLALSRGFRVGEIKVRHNKRKFGKSKYGFSRFITGALDLITIKFLIDYQKRPLHLFGFIGGLFSAVGFAITAYLILIRLSPILPN